MTYIASRYDRMTGPQNAVTHVIRYHDGETVECHSFAGAQSRLESEFRGAKFVRRGSSVDCLYLGVVEATIVQYAGLGA